ncbi:MAG: methyltransferase [Candidatus Tectomicrobia bacterium]|nr:methyltransferase [Candidatus Tectomicrobia bacterium]
MTTDRDAFRHTARLLRYGKILKASQQEPEQYTCKVLSKTFVVRAGVFSPKYFADTEFSVREMSIRQGEEFLEIGCGTGVASVFALLRGAGRAVAIDINPRAVQNTLENGRLHNVAGKLRAFVGDVYDALAPAATFDTIFWNIPSGYTDRQEVLMMEKAIFDPGYRSIKKFLSGAPRHLKESGRLLLCFSPTLGQEDVLRNLLRQTGFAVTIIAAMEIPHSYPVKFELLQASLRQT